MRFDDTLQTVMMQPAERGRALAVAWTQIVDILAQDRSTLSADLRQMALNRAVAVRPQVDQRIRRAMAVSIGARCRSPELVRFFAQDIPAVAAPVLSRAQLTREDWQQIIPDFSTPARALLRERRDLPDAIRLFLQNFGASDFALPPAMAGPDATNLPPAPPPAVEPNVGRPLEIDAFTFHTNADGLVLHVSGAPPACLIGLDLTQLALPGCSGVDGRAMGAVKGRSAFRDAHLRLVDAGRVTGDWLISGLPKFAQATGRMLGFAGSARRAPVKGGSTAAAASAHRAVTPADDALRQFLHEMRTPLNAVRGFAELMAVQLHGPVASAYRTRAQAMMAAADQVDDIFETLLLAGRVHQPDVAQAEQQVVNLGQMLAPIVAALHPMAAAKGVYLYVILPDDPPTICTVEDLVQKMATRLLQVALSAAQAKERINLRLVDRETDVRLLVTRPAALRPLEESQLLALEGAGGAESPLHPSFGIGLTLRLVRALAAMSGADFYMSRQSFCVRFPKTSTV